MLSFFTVLEIKKKKSFDGLTRTLNIIKEGINELEERSLKHKGGGGVSRETHNRKNLESCGI